MTTARCPHCGKPDAPVEDGAISRHRRADWDPNDPTTDKLHDIQLCAGGGLWLPVGERCHHLVANPDCLDAQEATQ
jgi:hypothetical protein